MQFSDRTRASALEFHSGAKILLGSEIGAVFILGARPLVVVLYAYLCWLQEVRYGIENSRPWTPWTGSRLAHGR